MTIMDKQKLNSDNFIRSYLIRKDLCQVSGCDEDRSMDTSSDVAPASIKPFDEDLQCGQIRLLADVEDITYIVLLRKWGDDAFLTMAFSHYDFPATNEEMSLERDVGLYLNVLQVWNTRTLLNETLRKSWQCGTLPEKLCSDAWTFWLSLTTGNELPDRLQEKSGAPIVDENDIRLKYLQEEMAVFAKVDSMDLALAETVEPSAVSVASAASAQEKKDNTLFDWIDGFILTPLFREEDSMALAAGSERKPVRRKCVIDGREEILHLAYSPEKGSVWIDIFSADDSDFSMALDGSEIVDADGIGLGTIQDGSCMLTVGKDFDGSIAIRLKDGTICTLAEKA